MFDEKLNFNCMKQLFSQLTKMHAHTMRDVGWTEVILPIVIVAFCILARHFLVHSLTGVSYEQLYCLDLLVDGDTCEAYNECMQNISV